MTLTRLEYENVNSPKRESIRDEIDRALRDALAFSAEQLTVACENRRSWMLTQGDVAGIPARVIAEELGPPFSLSKPPTITVRFCEGVSDADSNRPMETWVREHRIDADSNRPMETWVREHRIDVFDTKLDDGGSWIGFWFHRLSSATDTSVVDFSIRRVTFHELLHCLGDWQHDGLVRHNFVGVIAFERLIGGQDATGWTPAA